MSEFDGKISFRYRSLTDPFIGGENHRLPAEKQKPEVPHQWGCEMLKFGIKQTNKDQTSTMKR